MRVIIENLKVNGFAVAESDINAIIEKHENRNRIIGVQVLAQKWGVTVILSTTDRIEEPPPAPRNDSLQHEGDI